ncbi:hypothetical protein [Rhodococcus sp. X156]|uniref:hypothetical protein n=1 Tax=Rhodococcus sp. X156 TaxID=2499145 RepID=UPI000FDB0F9F|nr:hypothetical protein [Rhodococcus sp. X156]
MTGVQWTGVHWLYPTNPGRRCWVGRDAQDVLAPGNVRSRERVGEDGTATWLLSSGYRTMRPGDLVWLYAAGQQVLYAVARVLDVRHDEAEGSWVAQVAWCHEATEVLDADPLPRALFGQVPQSVQRANARTVEVLQDWLSSAGL